MTSPILQPFTLSFLVASLLLDLLTAGAHSEGIFMSLAFGQSFIAGGWLVLGCGP